MPLLDNQEMTGNERKEIWRMTGTKFFAVNGLYLYPWAIRCPLSCIYDCVYVATAYKQSFHEEEISWCVPFQKYGFKSTRVTKIVLCGDCKNCDWSALVLYPMLVGTDTEDSIKQDE